MSDTTVKCVNAADAGIQAGSGGCMQIDLLSDSGGMQTLWLPAANEGRYRLGENEGLPLYIHVKNGMWTAVCSDGADFVRLSACDRSTFEYYNAEILSDRHLIRMRYCGKEYVIYSEEMNSESNVFHNYFISGTGSISIGRTEGNSICYPNILVSRSHAMLRRAGGRWVISDDNSTNGTFVNSRKISCPTEINVGDTVYVMGLKLILGVDYISVNDGNGRVVLDPSRFVKQSMTAAQDLMPAAYGASEEKKLFNRLPRRRTSLEPKEITIEKPPLSMNSEQIPLLLRMGGSAVSAGASALMGNYLMLLSSVVFPVLTSKYSDKQKKDYEIRRTTAYREYLRVKALEIEREIGYEKAVLRRNYPELNIILDYAETKTQLWERRKSDDDFLSLRIGVGDIPMLAKKEYPDKGFSMEEDPLESEMYELAEKKTLLKNAPFIVDFKENFVCGITGPRNASLEFVDRLIMMTTVLHSYDEVKTVFLLDREQLCELDYIKYLPHAWDNQRSFRFIATTPSEAYQIGEYLANELGEDVSDPRELKKILKERPYYMIFALSKKCFDSMEILKDIMQCEKTCGVSIITVFDDVPKDCSLLFNLEPSGINKITYLRQIERSDDVFCVDPLNALKAKRSMERIANTSLKIVSQAYSLPKSLTFLELFGVGKAEHLNPRKRWQESNPIKTLSAPIGVATDGTIFCLDLHQKYQGPHGLVAGMTGSGKSEFLITYILSMAICYHPDEVSFVLIDYKGGGLAGAFDDSGKGIHLPHLVGTITNLDGSTIQRSLISLQSELMRRQRIFADAKKLTDDGTMDIYSYQKLYRNGKVSEPMPHLIIISDEFAELKQQEPEFMDNLISIARIGRSLGVHLILATQKPSGVVNDQILSNTKFRVCLKVQDKADSIDMLNRPEAAELKETGRFYLQVGYNEFFALGQNAWSGAEYDPQDEVVVQRDDSIQVIDNVGQNIAEIKPKPLRTNAHGTQLVAVVNLLSKLAEQENIRPRKLWKPQLERRIDVDSLPTGDRRLTEGGLPVVCAEIGLVDDPENQNQFVYNYDFTHSRNLMITGDQGSGKTTLVQTMLYSLIGRYPARELNFYIMDYSSRMLTLFKQMPSCGAAVTEENSDPEEFFKTIEGIIADRKKLFSEKELSSYDNVSPEMELPLILVFIDNISGLGATKTGEAQLYKLPRILKDGVNYGVKFIITCSKYSDASTGIRQAIGDRLSLHQKEKFDYAESLVCKVDYVPPEIPGRGLAVIDGRPLELHIATWRCFDKTADRIQYLKQYISDISNSDDSGDVQRLAVTSATAEYVDFAGQFKRGRLPLGIAQNNSKPISLPLKQFTQLSVYIGNRSGRHPLIHNLLYAMKREKADIIFVKGTADSCADSNRFGDVLSDARIYTLTQEDLTGLRNELISELTPRKAMLEDYCREKNISLDSQRLYQDTYEFREKNMPRKLVFIESMADFAGKLDFISSLTFGSMLSGLYNYNIFVIACYEPDDAAKANGSLVYSQFNINGTMLLFGGKYNEIGFCSLPDGAVQMTQKLPYNVCLMKYKRGFYSLVMPSGEITGDDWIDEDYLNIFE